MNPENTLDPVPPYAPDYKAQEITIAKLVGQVYEAAPATERCRILEHLMKPLGALSLVAVANGMFTKIWFRSGWHDLHIQPADAQSVQIRDVISLVQYVQQASQETIDGLAQLVTTSPVVACSAAAALLVTILVRRNRGRNSDIGENSGAPSAAAPTSHNSLAH